MVSVFETEVMFATLSWCCCRPPKEEDGPTDNRQSDKAVPRESKARASIRSITALFTSSRSSDTSIHNNHRDTQDPTGGFQDSSQTNTSSRNSVKLSVRERIKAFEVKGEKHDVRLREGRPKRKKPSSRAFEEFETQGIIIGFGNGPRRSHAESTEDVPNHEPEYGPRRVLPSLVQGRNNRRSSLELGVLQSGDEELNAVQRNSELLKSFRRAPPPKNRSKARRSGRRKAQLMKDSVQEDEEKDDDEDDDDDNIGSPGDYSCSHDHHEGSFEKSLHMAVTPTSQRLCDSHGNDIHPKDTVHRYTTPNTLFPMSERPTPLGATDNDTEEEDYIHTERPYAHKSPSVDNYKNNIFRGIEGANNPYPKDNDKNGHTNEEKPTKHSKCHAFDPPRHVNFNIVDTDMCDSSEFSMRRWHSDKNISVESVPSDNAERNSSADREDEQVTRGAVQDKGANYEALRTRSLGFNNKVRRRRP